ncbi:MAG TPA: hypothetical protein VK582_21855 [Pyrinomonadaceae bacterium]|nr:hypothetical protein [Pyrinomonadaceae bacterium]
MKNFRSLKRALIIQVAIVPFFITGALAQHAGLNRRTPADNQRITNDDTFRELMKADRETTNVSAASSDTGRAVLLKQLRDDFKSIQDVNNRMMAAMWAREEPDYDRVSEMISEINAKATRLKTNLSLPEPDGPKQRRKGSVISDARELRSALLVMDRSIMSFVKNPIFQNPKVMEVGLATQASQDLGNVIALSGTLRKISGNLKNSTVGNR